MVGYKHMRLMGIDYGKKRVGVAFTDDAGMMAFPHEVIPNTPKLLEILCDLIDEKEVGEIVIGHSLNKEGEPNEIQREIEELITDFTLQKGIPVHLEPEIYSTQEAVRFQGRTEKTDASAAAIILNSFITRNK
jgi:putative holliday junction resolvase